MKVQIAAPSPISVKQLARHTTPIVRKRKLVQRLKASRRLPSPAHGGLNAELFAELLKGALSPLQHGVEALTTSLDRMENRFNNG